MIIVAQGFLLVWLVADDWVRLDSLNDLAAVRSQNPQSTCGVNLGSVTSSGGAVVLAEEATKTITALHWTGC